MPEIGRDDFGHYEKGERRLCQGRLCSSNVQTEKDFAVKVCHHEDCQETNRGNPLLLCLRCDEVHHLGAGSNHARFDVPERPSTNIFRTPSSHSAGSDSGNEEDVESEHKVDKKNRGYSSGKRMFKLSAAAKKKPRRHNTEDPGREFFSIKFFDNSSGESHVEVVPVLKGKSLRDSIEPLFDAQDFSFATHSVFLDSSNTPLPLAFDTFPLGGNVLHVRANEDFKGDERVINIMRDSYAEDKSSADEITSRPKSSSFMARSGSFTTKVKDKGSAKKQDDDKEKENSKDEKLLQQFNKNTQKGKKNMESLFGKEFAGTMPPSLSSPVLPGGVHISGSATMPRPKSASSRLTGLFNQPKPSIKGTLKDSLERYSLYGLGESPDYDYGLKNEIEDQIKLETSWTEVVDESHIGAMTKKQKDQQEAIWELLSTEAAYISKLFVIKKLFLQCLRNLQSEGFLAEIEASKLFSNVEEIYEVNLAFWTEHLSKVIENARQTKDLLNPQEMEAGFNMFETQFDPYIKYCMEESSCLKYFKEKLIESEDFKTYITWCEEHRFCTDRLKLNDLLVKPMQRVTKYPLLLRAIYNKTMDDDDIKELVNRMRDKVEAFVSKVNGAMRERHELEKLKATAEKIHNNYNVVEAVSEEMEKILQDYSSYDLTRPMPGLTNDEHRSVIHEGPLRLLEKQGKMDVYVFLFTDLLLITKAKKGDKYKVIKPPLQVDKLFISTSKDQGTFLLIYVNEYNIAVQAFALQGTITDQANWIDAIKKAQKLFMVAKLGQGSSNILQMRNNSDLVSPSGLVTPSGLSPAFSRLKRRSSSVSSIMSIDSDSDDESGLNIPNINSRARSDSAVTSASSTHSSEVRGKDVETDEKDDAVRQPQAEILSPEEEGAMGAMARPRSESVGKISRSSSAPPKERPRVVDSSSLSRSSSAPQGPTSARVASLREGIIKRMATEEQDGSITSSSASLNDSAGDSEVQSPSTTTSADFPSLPPPDYQQTSEVRTEPQSPNQEDCEIEPSLPPAEEDITQCPSSPEKGVSSSLSDNDCETSEHAGEQEEDSVEEPLESQGDLSPNEDCKVDLSIPQLGFTPGFHALQNLSHSLESTFKSNGPSKQAPQIKSQLIAQDKIQSAITLTEPPRKRISLPCRSSPVVSRKSRPQNLKKSREKDDHDINGILQKIRDASSASCSTTTEATTSNQERVCKVGKLTKRSSESSRLPVKPDKAHYPTSLDLESHPKADKKKEMPSNSLSRSRKKSMSLSDLLSIGKDLTSNREKSKDKDVDKDKSRPKSLEATSPQTDEEAVSPNYVDGHDNKKEEKKSRFSRLRRKSSRGVGELKDGIASGPDIDPKRASRHFFKESLMLETSEYV